MPSLAGSALCSNRLQSASDYQIIFRQSKIVANAFVLPYGQVLVNDQLVRLLSDDDALMCVLAHELGHLQRRHLMRRLVQGSAVGATVTSLVR